ncbi:MAG: hypothetical protein U0414_12760 [Polyangiaceae bacterium]
MKTTPLQLGLIALGLVGCAQILGVDEEAHLGSSGSSGGAASSTVSSTGTGGAPMCSECTPADDCMQGACEGGMCTVTAKPEGAPCGGGVCSSEAKCVECLTGRDCASAAPLCLPDHHCVPATCTNLSKDGDETGIDCGGSCSRCANGLGCGVNADCASGHCEGVVCAPCADDGDCDADRYCVVGTGVCEEKRFDGVACATANECKSARCVGGTGGVKVCCDTDCAAGCASCLAAETNAPQGKCANVRVGLDPKDACPALPCMDGTCDGGGACTTLPAGAPCSTPSCAGTAFDPPDLCDAMAQCTPTASMACAGNLSCVAGACLSACVAQTDCVSGYYCAATACLVKKANGSACNDSFECQSNNCAGNHKCKP